MPLADDARAAGSSTVSSLRVALAERMARVMQRDPELVDTAVEVGIVDRKWLAEPGQHPLSTATTLDMVQRFLERSVERKPSALASIGLNAIQMLSWNSEAKTDEGVTTDLAIAFTDLEGFTKFTATATGDEKDAAHAGVQASIDVASIDTGDEKRDAHLKTADFFDAEKFPTITFKSTSMKFDGDRVVGVEGDLTMLGVTKPVTLTVVNMTCGPQPFNKKPMCGGEATATIKRSDWGMTAGLPFAPGDEVKLIIPIEAYKAET